MRDSIQLVIFDLNETLIDASSWPEFNKAMGMSEQEDLVLWKLNQEGILPNKMWVEIVNNLYNVRGIGNKDKISNVLLNYTYLPNAREIVGRVKEKYRVAIVSGAPDFLVEHVANELDIDLYGSNALLVFDEQDNFQEMVVLHEEPISKIIFLQEFCRRLNIHPNQVACVGDGANDSELFKRTGKGITFDDSPIKDLAWKTISNLEDLDNILKLK